jgi:hypothetical protein
MRSSHLICYDISDDKRLLRVFQDHAGVWGHLQYSVFECQFTAADLKGAGIGSCRATERTRYPEIQDDEFIGSSDR